MLVGQRRNNNFSTVKTAGRMRFNKAELAALAGQPSHKFEKEGVLFVRERQDGFFRRTETPTKKSRGRFSNQRRSIGCYGGLVGKVSVERWCRLRGNLLFYFKSRDHFSDPAGMIVIEDCKVDVDSNSLESTFGIILTFQGGYQQHLATYTEYERNSWLAALRAASHSTLRAHLDALRERLRAKVASNAALAESLGISANDVISNAPNKELAVTDPSETPILEISLSCDNLLCDSLGRAPSARLVVQIRNPSELVWRSFSQTEIAEKSSNPNYLRTISFHPSDGVNDNTEIRVTALDIREKVTSTRTHLGRAIVNVGQLKENERIRIKLESPNPEGRTAGFVTINAWTYEVSVPGSTDSTPFHTCNKNKNDNVGSNKTSINSNKNEGNTKSKNGHRRTQSLPPVTKRPSNTPNHRFLNMIFANPIVKTYRFHSGLGGDINVQEVMADSKLCFTFPQQLLSLWICEEKELVHEMAGLGELKSPWHECQMRWLENHLHVINAYTQALENLDSSKVQGRHLRKSSEKSETTFEFVPVNLQLQRIWAHNDSLRKSGFYDVFTHGGFSNKARKSPGLIKMLKDLKSPQNDSNAWCTHSDRLQLAEDTLKAIRRVRREVVDNMRILMKKAKEKKANGMFQIVEEMMRKTRCLCSLLDPVGVEEIFLFLEENRIDQRPEKDEFSESVAEFMQRNKLKIDLFRPGGLGGKFEKLQTPNTEFICKELQTPDFDFYHLYSPADQAEMAEFWRCYSAYTSGYQSIDRLSDIDEFEESFKYLSVVDKTKHYYTLCKAGSPLDTPVASPKKCKSPTSKQSSEVDRVFGKNYDDDEGLGHEDENDEVMHIEVKNTIIDEEDSDRVNCDKRKEDVEQSPDKPNDTTDNQAKDDETSCKENDSDNSEPTSNSKSPEDTSKVDKHDEDEKPANGDSANDGLHYRAGDEPEPIDLTHLNIEAAMMSLASKVRILCGKSNSPTLGSRTFRFRELDTLKKNSSRAYHERDTPALASGIPKSASHDSTFKTVEKPPQPEQEIPDWCAEIRASMRKLRQGMDSLCKTSRLVCSVLRLQQMAEAVDLSMQIKYRRDICFSQALTTLVTGLMGKFWSLDPDPMFLHICSEIGPLVCFESLLSLHGEDVAIFNDMIVAVEDLRSVEFTLILVDDKRTKKSKIKPGSKLLSGHNCHSFPMPRITGSRSNLKVLLPVPDYVYTMLPMDKMKSLTFNVNPVMFNIGINEKATIAGRFGGNAPQEKNNLDNFKILAEYYRRFKKIEFPTGMLENRGARQWKYSNEPDVDDLLSILKNEVSNRKNKNVDVLHLSSQICRRLSGLRFTNCKSAKDRTAMSVTLEQVQILSRDFDLAEHEYQKALDVMRSEGTRRDNVRKNVNEHRYALDSIKLTTFPYQYRPPAGTYGSRLA